MIDGGTIQQRQAYYTPGWAMHALYERHFSFLKAGDVMLEPTCGDAGFLVCPPPHVDAIGCEIDAQSARRAELATGRRVIHGDVRTVALPTNITAVLGNPPFKLKVFDQILDRCHDLLPKGAMAGFILPAYALQTSGRVMGYSERWSLETEMLPKAIFGRLASPLVFCKFFKDRRRQMVGFALYPETFAVTNMRPEHRELLNARTRTGWRDVVASALTSLGGTASLPEIYAAVEPRRPTDNPYWQEKVRQVLRQSFIRLHKGCYALSTQHEMALAA